MGDMFPEQNIVRPLPFSATLLVGCFDTSLEAVLFPLAVHFLEPWSQLFERSGIRTIGSGWEALFHFST
jgi:hypothetical protein